MKILSVVGTRPNLMKTAPIIAELRCSDDFEHVLVHTGQHYDHAMSEIFFDQLGIPAPDHYLDVGSGSHSQMTARVMERLEPVVLDTQPDVVLAPGDVNSTLAAALVTSKLMVPLGHIEAGLRSFDRSMPEEVNRVLTDAVSDLLFTHSPEAEGNLLREGVVADRVHFVGNTMIDTLVAMRERIEAVDAATRFGIEAGTYLVVTLHRPALVDGPLLADATASLREVADEIPIVFPIHPRTRAAIDTQGIDVDHPQLHLIEPIGYLEFLSLVASSAGVLTDSGGIQEETTYLGIPCFTLRDNTERPVTIELGTNVLLGLRPDRIAEVPELLRTASAHRSVPPLWDGRASGRVVEVLARFLARPRDAAPV